jgi:hypothetical protein
MYTGLSINSKVEFGCAPAPLDAFLLRNTVDTKFYKGESTMKRAFATCLGLFTVILAWAPATAADFPPRYGQPLAPVAPVYYSVFT